MKLRDIGEFGLIEKIAKILGTPQKGTPLPCAISASRNRVSQNGASLTATVIKGIGDDCAVLSSTKDKYLLITTDMLIEGVHFKISEAAPQQIGHKAMAVNISDIAACGGIGKWAVVSVGLPKALNFGFVKRIYIGMKTLASEFNIDIVGGDTNISDKVIISVTLIGFVKKKNLVLRRGAKNGDIIFLTGKLKLVPDDLNFIPRIKESQFLVNNFKINSMIDISDGLLSDLGHILEESKAGARLYESLIPCHGSNIKKALSTGEQFELLFTVNRKDAKELLHKANSKKIKISAIGEITDNTGKIVFIDKEGRREEVKAEGYRHF